MPKKSSDKDETKPAEKVSTEFVVDDNIKVLEAIYNPKKTKDENIDTDNNIKDETDNKIDDEVIEKSGVVSSGDHNTNYIESKINGEIAGNDYNANYIVSKKNNEIGLINNRTDGIGNIDDIDDDEEGNEDSESSNLQFRIRKLGEQKDEVKVNKFDLICIKIWTIIVSAVTSCALGLNWVVNAIFKKKLPLKYVRAFVSAILIILVVIVFTLPFKITVNKKPTVDVFTDGLLPVQVQVGNDSDGMPIFRWGYAKKNGSLAIKATYNEALPFAYGVAWVRTIKEEVVSGIKTKDDYWQLIDKKGRVKGNGEGNEKLKFYYSAHLGSRPVGNFTSAKLAWVNVSGMYGYINTSGNIEIETKYNHAEDFAEGLARVTMSSNEFYINKKGKTIGTYFQKVKTFSEGLGAVKINNLWGFMNTNGKVSISPEYDDVSSFIGGYAVVRRNVTFGIINQKGKYVVEPHSFRDLYTSNEQLREYVDEMMKRMN